MLPILAKRRVKSQRRVSDLYARDDEELAGHFRARLDQRLHDRYHAPVAWDVEGAGSTERDQVA
jgi:hypothetical protein